MVKQSKLLKGAKYSLFFLFLIVLSSVVASATAYSDFNSKQKGELGYGYCEWREGGFFSERTSNQDGCEGNIPYHSNNTVISSLGVGASLQPLISNFQDGGDNYLITASGTDIDIISMSSTGGLSLYAQINLGSTLSTNPIMLDLNSDTYTDMLVSNGTNLFSIYYNISDPLLFTIHNVYNGNLRTGISCMNVSTNIYCFIGGDDGVSQLNISVYNVSSRSVINYNVSSSGSFSDNINWGLTNTPIINDWDNDGILELIILNDNDGDNNEGFSVYQLSSVGVPTLERNIDDVGSAAGIQIKSLLLYDLDGVGDNEVCLSGYQSSAGAGEAILKCYNSDGSLFGSVIMSGGGTVNAYPLNLIVAHVNSSITLSQICTVTSNSVSGSDIMCYDGIYGSLRSSLTDDIVGFGATMSGSITSNDINSDGVDEILALNYIYYSNQTTFNNFTLSSFSGSGTAFSVVGDVNNDGYAEACQSLATSTTCISSTGTGVGGSTNLLPELWANFGRGYNDPICNNTLLRFSAKEDTTQNIANFSGIVIGTNYVNDISENEYLAIDCYGNSSYTYGNVTSTQPYIECLYTKPGTYYPQIWVCDSAHTNGQCLTGSSNYETQSLYVINGIPGTTCNIESLGIGTIVSEVTLDIPSFGGTPSDITSGWTNLFGYLSGGNSNAKLFIGFVLLMFIMVGTAVGLARLGVGGSALAIIALLASGIGFILLTMVGLFPVWILVLLLLVLALITGLVLALKSGAGG